MTNKVVVLINGRPRAGKDTFCNMAHGKVVSAVDLVKAAAAILGWPLDRKLPADRQGFVVLRDSHCCKFQSTVGISICRIHKLGHSPKYKVGHTIGYRRI